ncbi:hypothetical protein N9Z54_08935, partial [Planctomycetota bacterium]|nr:hypothetical protein [Planctomycetota bacterium]
ALRLEQQGLTLTATIAGRVGLVEAHPGQVLLAGALVARVEAADARNVTVFLPEPVAAGSEAPEVVLLSRRGSPAKVTRLSPMTKISSVAPMVRTTSDWVKPRE